jgi:hypothetical protein
MKKIIALLCAAVLLIIAVQEISAQSGYWTTCVNASGQRYQCFVATGHQVRQPISNESGRVTSVTTRVTITTMTMTQGNLCQPQTVCCQNQWQVSNLGCIQQAVSYQAPQQVIQPQQAVVYQAPQQAVVYQSQPQQTVVYRPPSQQTVVYQPPTQRVVVYRRPPPTQVYYPSSARYPSGSQTVTEQIRIDRGYGSGWGRLIPRVRYGKKVVTKRQW